MAFYESIFIVRQDVSAGDVEKIADTFTKVVKDNGGTVVKKESWGLRNLAYKVKKNRKGHYIMLCLDAPAAVITELQRQYKLHEDVIRYMTVAVEEISKKPSPILAGDKYKDKEAA